MSTKQTVLYTLMIFFLVVLLVAMGAWFKSSMELNDKTNLKAALTIVENDLKRQLDGLESDRKQGLKYEVDDPQEGLKALDEKMIQQVALLKSNANDPGNLGMQERLDQFEKLGPEVEKAWSSEAGPAWKALYEGWDKQSQDLNKQLENLKTQRDEKEKAVLAAAAELATEENNREVEISKIAKEKAKNAQELEGVRIEHEAAQQKVTEISREYSKVKKPVAQGKIMQADPSTKIAVINIGAAQGVRKGMTFEVYDGSRAQLVRKGLLEISEAGPLTSRGILLDAARETRWDPVTHWVPTSPDMKFSPLATKGAEDNEAQELEKRRSVKDRIDALRLEKIAREQGLEAAENARENSQTSANPPSDLSLALTPVAEGDWVFSAEFVPIVPESEFREQNRAELISMKDVNVGPLTFYIADTVRPYRKEYLKRLCERNGCKVSSVMSPNVNFVVTGIGFNRLDLVTERVGSKKGKENLKEEDKAELSTLAALEDARKYAADVISEDGMEAFFDRRARKQELLRGKLLQPGKSVFFVAGKTKGRTPELLGHYIETHGGVMASDINEKIDYVVVGEAPEDAFIENIKKRGLKIIREDELPEFFGDKR
jgi:hypothetical protein